MASVPSSVQPLARDVSLVAKWVVHSEDGGDVTSVILSV
jgi:hypothetical protein